MHLGLPLSFSRAQLFADSIVTAMKRHVASAEDGLCLTPSISVSHIHCDTGFSCLHLIFSKLLQSTITLVVLTSVLERNVYVNQGWVLLLHCLIQIVDHLFAAFLCFPPWVNERCRVSDRSGEKVGKHSHCKQTLPSTGSCCFCQ